MLKCLIIDDEQSCVDTLQAMLHKKFNGQVHIAATTTNPHEAAELIALHKPDMIFLDVEMPRMSGVEILRSIPNIDFQVIFITAHQHYAIQAIKLNVLDYLLKPVSISELSAAIKKCMARSIVQDNTLINTFLQQLKPGGAAARRIAIASADTTQYVPINEIIRIESQSNYSTVYFISRTKLLVSKTLKEFEDQLIPFDFLRVHHSHLINLEHVIGYKNQDGGYVIMQGNDAIEISRRKKQEVMQRLNTL